LSQKVIALLGDEKGRKEIAVRGKNYAQEFNWDVVAEKIYDVYEMAMVGGSTVTLSSENRAWYKFLGRQS
jgi:phosphatidylinositol alpha-mannosyltransferase